LHRASNLRFSPDGNTLLLSSLQGFQLWDTATGKVKGNVAWTEFTRTGPFEFAPDSRLLAHADREGRVTLWDTADAREVYYRQLPGSVASVAFAQGHRYLATGNSNGTVYIFRLP
jgi:WD40 repeat protein